MAPYIRLKLPQRVAGARRIVALLAKTLGASVHAHRPRRAMANQGVALIMGHCFRAHAVEIIIGGIVFTDMVEAEAEILALAKTAHWRAELARFAAARILAARQIWARHLPGFGLNPDAVEQT